MREILLRTQSRPRLLRSLGITLVSALRRRKIAGAESTTPTMQDPYELGADSN